MIAIWNDKIIARSDFTRVVEGNHYFPPESVRMDLLKENQHTTTCPWKGQANYYDLVIDSQVIESAAWTFHEPSEAAAHIKDHIAFWKGVEVREK